jgi:hypothetical protein
MVGTIRFTIPYGLVIPPILAVGDLCFITQPTHTTIHTTGTIIFGITSPLPNQKKGHRISDLGGACARVLFLQPETHLVMFQPEPADLQVSKSIIKAARAVLAREKRAARKIKVQNQQGVRVLQHDNISLNSSLNHLNRLWYQDLKLQAGEHSANLQNLTQGLMKLKIDQGQAHDHDNDLYMKVISISKSFIYRPPTNPAQLAVVLMICLWVISPCNRVFGQSEVDAVRFAGKDPALGARALGMGSSFMAVSDDFSALYANPAGLGLLRQDELLLGFGSYSNFNTASYLGTRSESDPATTGLDVLGLALPFPTVQGSFVMAFGYSRSTEFESGQLVGAFNPSQSINTYFTDAFSPQLDDGDPPGVLLLDPGALAFDTYLQDISGDGSSYINPQVSNGEVFQSSTLNESGGIDMFSMGASVEVAEDVFVGGALNIYYGEYKYLRTFREDDTENVYATFESLELEDQITSDISGYNLKLGLLYRIDEAFRFGLTIETPIVYEIEDRYNTILSTTYDQPPQGATETAFSSGLDGSFSYSLDTPYRFGVGLSYSHPWITLNTQAEWQDWSQMSIADDEGFLEPINRVIESDLQETYALSAGLELKVPGSGVFLRTGYRYEQSPYKYTLADPTKTTGYDDAKKTWSVGLGVLLKSSLSLDFAVQQTSYRFENRLYSNSPIVEDNLSQTRLQLTTQFWF